MQDLTQKQNSRFIKKLPIFIFILILMFVSFKAGLLLAGKNETVKELAKDENVYLGKLLGLYGSPETGKLSRDVDFKLFWDVWDTIKRDHVDKDKLNEKEMFYGALKGLVESVKDPYTVFMDPKLTKEFVDSLTGTFEGIGAEIGIRNEVLTIIAPLAETPAEKAGLMAGDKVYAINDESTAGINIDDAVRKIRGPKGTEVKLTISRDGFESAKDITITRETIVVKSVKTEVKNTDNSATSTAESNSKDGIFVIEINNFNSDTSDLFNKAVNDAIKANPKGIILDLRNNPGGYLDTAIEVASEWIEKNVVLIEKFNENAEDNKEYLSRDKARLKDYKTVVLVNQGSASASEIVAGALKDYGKATIVGMKTFGKGSVQTIEDFNDGSSVKITIAKWLTPKGNYINEKGVSPDVEVDMKIEDVEAGKDPQMDKAMELLRK